MLQVWSSLLEPPGSGRAPSLRGASNHGSFAKWVLTEFNRVSKIEISPVFPECIFAECNSRQGNTGIPRASRAWGRFRNTESENFLEGGFFTSCVLAPPFPCAHTSPFAKNSVISETPYKSGKAPRGFSRLPVLRRRNTPLTCSTLRAGLTSLSNITKICVKSR